MEPHTTRDLLPRKGDHYIFSFLCVMYIKQISSPPNIKSSELSEKGTHPASALLDMGTDCSKCLMLSHPKSEVWKAETHTAQYEKPAQPLFS